jgi:hypothetical protein
MNAWFPPENEKGEWGWEPYFKRRGVRLYKTGLQFKIITTERVKKMKKSRKQGTSFSRSTDPKWVLKSALKKERNKPFGGAMGGHPQNP